jgi:hypothetical protein
VYVREYANPHSRVSPGGGDDDDDDALDPTRTYRGQPN